MWIRILCSLCLIFLVSCGTTPFLTKHGFFVKPNGNTVKQLEIELATDLLKEVFDTKGIYTTRQIEQAFSYPGYTIEIRTNLISCPKKDKPKRTCQGLHYGSSKTILYVHHNELYDTSLVHELMHMAKEKVEGNADGGHVDLVFWEIACKRKYKHNEVLKVSCEMNSVEGFTNSMLRGVLENG